MNLYYRYIKSIKFNLRYLQMILCTVYHNHNTNISSIYEFIERGHTLCKFAKHKLFQRT